MNGSKNEFQITPAILRVAAIFLVISLHVSDEIVSRTNYLGGVSWWIGDLLNSLARSGVPIFLMISGYLLLNSYKTDSYLKIFKRSFFRIVVPLVIWFLVFFFWRHIWYGDEFDLSYLYNSFWQAKVFHLYFLFIILGLYLLIPFIKKLMEVNLRMKILYITGSFIFGAILVSLSYLFQTRLFGLSFTLFIPYLGYFIVGDFLYKLKLKRPQFFVIFALFVISWLLTAYLTFLNYSWHLKGQNILWSNSGGQYFGEYLSPPVILMSLSIVLLLKNLNAKNSFINKPWPIHLLKLVSASAFGVYLIHPIVMDLLDHYGNLAIHLVKTNLYLFLFEKIFLVFFISFGLSYILLITPLLKLTVGEYHKLDAAYYFLFNRKPQK